MRRLRQEVPSNAAFVGAAIDLVRATPATQATPEAKRRVWAALEASRAAAWTREQSAFSRARWFAVTMVIVCLAGTASALVGHRWLHVFASRLTARPAQDSVPAGAAAGRRRAVPPAVVAGHAARPIALEDRTLGPADAPERPARGPSSAEARLGPDAPPEGTLGPAEPSSASALRAVRRSVAGPRPSPAPPERARVALGPSEVLDAMVALRRDHDPVRASELLAQYLARHPGGALREEALVLSIEAAAARRDDAAVREFAQQYRRHYPGGHFHSVVESYATTSWRRF